MRAFILTLLFSALASFAADDSARIADLEQKLSDLDKKYRALEQKVGDKPAAKNAPTVSIGANGVSFQSSDTNFILKLHTLLQLDSRWYFEGGVNDTWILRRARPIIFEGTFYNDFDFLLVPDFANGRASGGVATASTPTVLDAYLNYRYRPELQLRAGKMKEPVGLEELQSDSAAFMIERSFVSNLLPNRDVGVALHGEILENTIGYTVGVFNGVADAANTGNVDFDDQKDLAARLFFHPFITTDIKPLKGLGVGIGATIGSREGAGAISAYATEALTPFFTYTNGVVGDGRHLRWTPQMYYYFGPFGLMAEYAVSRQDIRLGSTRARMDHDAWQVTASYVLTGDDASYKGVVPKHPFHPSTGDWGAVELVGRVSELDIDDEAFPTFSFANTSATRAAAYTVGLNWYLNRNLRSAINYVHTDFKGGPANPATQGDEDALMTRFQLVF